MRKKIVWIAGHEAWKQYQAYWFRYSAIAHSIHFYQILLHNNKCVYNRKHTHSPSHTQTQESKQVVLRSMRTWSCKDRHFAHKNKVSGPIFFLTLLFIWLSIFLCILWSSKMLPRYHRHRSHHRSTIELKSIGNLNLYHPYTLSAI